MIHEKMIRSVDAALEILMAHVEIEEAVIRLFVVDNYA